MKMIVKVMAAGALALAALGACADPPVSGTVVHRQYSAAYSYITYYCVSYDKNGLCAFNMPVSNHMPASYQVCVKGIDKKGKQAEGCIEVPPNEYAAYAEGDPYPRHAE